MFASRDVRVHPQMDGLLTSLASVLLGVVGLVLAVACSNLATLLLVRGTARAKEVSVRLALGATRGQLVRQLLAESLLLSVAGGIAGCILAWWGIRVARRGRPAGRRGSEPRLPGPGLRARALARHRRSVRPRSGAQGHEPRPGADAARRRRAAIVGPPLAHAQERTGRVPGGGVGRCCSAAPASFLQLVSASQAQRPGFAVDGVAMLETDARYAGYSAAEAGHGRAKKSGGGSGRFRACNRRCSPGACRCRRWACSGGRRRRHRGRGPGVAPLTAGAIWAGPGFFDVLGIPILFGRALDERDRRDTPTVAVISETMARQYFGTGEPAAAVGRRFRLDRDPDANAWIEVVGVARDTGTADLAGRPRRSHPAVVLSLVRTVGACRRRPCWRGRRPTPPASSAPCNASCAR